MIKRTTTTKPRADGSELVSVRWTFLGIPFFGIQFSLDKPEAPDSNITRTTRLGGRTVVMTRHGDPVIVAPGVPLFAGRTDNTYTFRWTGGGWARWAALMAEHSRTGAFKALSAGASTKYATVSLDRTAWAAVLDIVGNNKNGQRLEVEAVSFGLQA